MHVNDLCGTAKGKVINLQGFISPEVRPDMTEKLLSGMLSLNTNKFPQRK